MMYLTLLTSIDLLSLPYRTRTMLSQNHTVDLKTRGRNLQNCGKTSCKVCTKGLHEMHFIKPARPFAKQ